MAKYEYEGTVYDVDDAFTTDEAISIITNIGKSQGRNSVERYGEGLASEAIPNSSSISFPNVEPNSWSVDPTSLSANEDWLKASAIRYKADNGKDLVGTKEDLAEYGLDVMGWFNYNLPKMGIDTSKLQYARPEEKAAFLYMLDTYDNLQLSWGGAGRFIKGVALDPTSWVGLSTLGIGAATGTATKLASKEALKSALRVGTHGAIEGAVNAAASSAILQTAEKNAGRGDGVDLGRLAGDTAIGAGAGALLGAGLDAVATGLRKPKVDINNPPVNASEQAPPAAGPQVASGSSHSSAGQATSPAATPVAQPAPSQPATSVATPTGQTGQVHTPTPNTPAEPDGNAILKAIEDIAQDTGMRQAVVGKEALEQATEHPLDLLSRVSPAKLSSTIEELRRAKVDGEERQLLDHTIARAAQKVNDQWAELYRAAKEDPQALNAALPQLDKLEQIQSRLIPADLDVSSFEGRMLGARVGLFNTGDRRGITVDSLLEVRGIDPATATKAERDMAREEMFKAFDAWEGRARARTEIVNLNKEIEDLVKAGDLSTAQVKIKERDRLISKFTNEEAQNALPGLWRNGLEIGHSGLKKFNEFVISTVFTPATLVRNTIPAVAKTLYKPAVDYVVRGPFDLTAYKQMTSTYSAMASSTKVALQAAKAAFKYERALLSDNTSELAVYHPEIKGLKGRILRFFPRVLGATDEFFGQINVSALYAPFFLAIPLISAV